MKKLLALINLLLVVLLIWFIKSDLDDKISQKIDSIINKNVYENELLKIKKNAKSRNKLIELNIQPEHLDQLLATRLEFLRVGYIGNDIANPYHPAKISLGSKEYSVKLRFKGDFLDHISDIQKWSLKIKVLNNETIFGMKEFAIQRPETRNGFGEYAFHKVLHYNGMLSIPYDFIWVQQNGKDHGIYAYEGRMKNKFFKINGVERQPILRINDELYFKAKRNLGNKAKRGLNLEDWSSYAAIIDAYQLDKILSNKKLKKSFEIATTKLENFRLGKLKAKEVFNITKLAKFYVIADLFSAYHAQQFPNLRFYYNSHDSLLEPIGFDADGLSSRPVFFGQELAMSNDKIYNGRRYEHRLNYLLEDKDFVLEYHKYLAIFSREKFIINMEDSLKNEFEERKGISKILNYKHEFLRKNQAFIRSKIYPVKGVHAFLNDIKADSIILNLSNPNYLATEILSIQQNGKNIAKPVFNDWLRGREQNKVAPIVKAIFKTTEIKFDKKKQFYIRYKIPGIDSVYNDPINLWNNQINDKSSESYIK